MRAQLSASLLYPLQMIDAERRRVRGIALVLIVACGLLSGCAAEPRVENTSQALDLDQVPQSRVNDAMIACLADKGWSARMDWGARLTMDPCQTLNARSCGQMHKRAAKKAAGET